MPSRARGPHDVAYSTEIELTRARTSRSRAGRALTVDDG
jgi:hypothetical protein